MILSNAPVSWGVYYAEGAPVTPDRYLDEVAAAGYGGTELGPLGFLPTDPAVLSDLLGARGLTLAGAVHVHDFTDPEGAAALETALNGIGVLLATSGARVLTVMDAGQAYDSKDASGERVSAVAATLEVARARLADRWDLDLAFHPHVLTAIERENQIDQLLAESSVSICLDTGHHAFWGTDPADYLDRIRNRVSAIHLKNVEGNLRDKVLSGRMPAAEAMARGAFCPLDAGVVDIHTFLDRLGDFAGPVVVEQDWVPSAAEPPVALAQRNANFLGERFRN
jgi:inosose dehydratase